MQVREPQITEDGIIRCPSPDPDSYHEFRFANGNVLYRRTNAAGQPYGEYADWRALSGGIIADHYYAGADALRRWFHGHGFTAEHIHALREQDEANKTAARRRRR